MALAALAPAARAPRSATGCASTSRSRATPRSASAARPTCWCRPDTAGGAGGRSLREAAAARRARDAARRRLQHAGGRRRHPRRGREARPRLPSRRVARPAARRAGRRRAARTARARRAVTAALAGLEYAEGIPGTVGGALFMNAGAYGGEMAGVVEAVEGVDADGSRASTLAREALRFSYRRATCRRGFVVTAVGFRLRPDDPAAVRARLERRARRRLASQPQGQPNAGSIFKNPRGDYAGPADRGRRPEGRARRGRAHLGAARELHRERRRGARGGRAGADGDRPAGGVGAEWGMAGARGAARRQLVEPLAPAAESPPTGVDAGPRCPGAATLGGGAGRVARRGHAPVLEAGPRTHPYFADPRRGDASPRPPAGRRPARRRSASRRVRASGTSIPLPRERRLRARPGCGARTVQRELPDRVVVRVREDRPAAIVAVSDGHPGLYYVAANGRIFAPVGQHRRTRLAVHHRARPRRISTGATGFGPRAVHRALGLLRLVGREPADRAGVGGARGP